MGSRPVLSLALIASLSAGGEGSGAALAAGPAAVSIGVGQAAGFSHIEFRGAQPHSARREGSDLVLRFAALAPPDVSSLKIAPPKYLKSAATAMVNGGTEIRLTLAPGADAKIGRADGSTYVNLFMAAVAAPSPDQTPDQVRGPASARSLDPLPASGEVAMRSELKGDRLLLHLPWRAPLGAAAFRRGDAIWLVFDTKAVVDLSQAPSGLRQLAKVVQVADDHATALRLTVPTSIQASLTAEGDVWTLALGPGVEPPAPVSVKPDLQAMPTALTAQVAGSTGVFWLNDPAVGDRIAVVTARGPAKGVPQRRAFVDAALLMSQQGLAVEPFASDLSVVTDGDIVRISRPKGLDVSQSIAETAPPLSPAPLDLPQPAALPAVIDVDAWSKTGAGGFLARYDQLLSGASAETAEGKGASVQARFGLARFLAGSELSFEAMGVLDLIAKDKPAVLQDAQFRGLRGAMRAMAGRYKDAEADFSSPTLAEDPSSALWRGYVSQKLGDNAGARQQFASGRSALARFDPKWRARFAGADAEAALALGDLGAARADLAAISPARLEATDAQAIQLDQARLLEAGGQTEEALALYGQVATSGYGALAAPALLHATEIQLKAGRLQPQDAIAALDSLRFRWRGDATELETVRALGRIYLSQGRYRDAMEAMQSGSAHLSDLPAAAAVRDDLAAAFRDLFLNGAADGLPPIQALGLFFDFKALTPIGADGDMMVRKLARRLVDVDLLDQAATLLKYQADNRLDGAPRAEVDTDLAMIELMDKQPEAALDALNGSRSTLLPPALSGRRRVLQARALSALGQYDAAVEFLGKDASPDGADLRAEIAWRQRDWAKAGSLLEAQLGDRWKSSLPLGGLDQTRLLRAGVAYSLANDDTSLARLRTRYAKLAEAAPNPAALQVALSGVDAGPYTAADYARAASDAEAFSGWVAAMKAKYLSAPV